MSYYGLISGLPQLQPTQNRVLEPSELRTLLTQYLEESDRKLVYHFFYQIDLINLNARIQDKDMWLEGGNMSKSEISQWHEKGKTENTPFDDRQESLQGEEHDKLREIQLHWQRFYDTFFSLAPDDMHNLIRYEISLKNFFKGYLERKIKAKEGVHFIDGGYFDRFTYNKLLIGDIQAEHPYLAGVLNHFEEVDPFERERKMIEAKWNYYHYEGFFDAFGIKRLITWLLQYLDLHKWQQNNTEKGKRKLEVFSQNLIQQTKAEIV